MAAPVENTRQSLDQRDPGYIRKLMPLARLACRLYFRSRVQGLDYIPPGPVLFVSNHSGGLATPDTIVVSEMFWRRFGPERRVYALVHPSIFGLPSMASHILRAGGLPATARAAEMVLRSKASLLIYPGAGREAYRTWHDRHRVVLGDDASYLRLALHHAVPIVPVVCNGGHESFVCLDDGENLAAALGLKDHGVERIPLTWSVPWGLQLGTGYFLPLPVRIDVKVGRPIELRGFTRAARKDRNLLESCHRQIEQTMQGMLDELVALRRVDKAPTIQI
jgi:1-acyl-sn-glycerol-3-phosphate acyltransferase